MTLRDTALAALRRLDLGETVPPDDVRELARYAIQSETTIPRPGSAVSWSPPGVPVSFPATVVSVSWDMTTGWAVEVETEKGTRTWTTPDRIERGPL